MSNNMSDDLLEGAEAIAAYLFGDKKKRRTVYNLVEKSALPTFRLGAILCARKSTLSKFIADQERETLARATDSDKGRAA